MLNTAQSQTECRNCKALYDDGLKTRRYYPGDYQSIRTSYSRFEREQYDLFNYDGMCPNCVSRTSREKFCADLQERGLTKRNLLGKVDKEKHAQSMTQNPDAWRIAKEWTGKENLFIYGPIGVGKTSLARRLLRRAAGNLVTVAETDMRKIPDANRVAFGEQREMLDVWKSVPVLLIDDLDKVFNEAMAVKALFDLLDDRHGNPEAGRRTIITANASHGAVWRKWSDAIAGNSSIVDGIFDRLNPCVSIAMKGESLRSTLPAAPSGGFE